MRVSEPSSMTKGFSVWRHPKDPDTGLTSNRGSQTRKPLPRGPPPHEIGHLCCARPTPPRGGTPSISLIHPAVEGGPKSRGGSALMPGGCLKAQGSPKNRGGGSVFPPRSARRHLEKSRREKSCAH